MRDCEAGTTQCVSVSSDGVQADGSSRNPVISADGVVVVFESFASLTSSTKPRNPENDGQTNQRSRIYLHSMTSKRTMMAAADLDRVASATPTRDGEPAISGDGSTLVFNELPLFENPEHPVGEVAQGDMFRVGSCLLSPDFAVTSIKLNGVSQPVGGNGENVLISMRPLSIAPNLEVELEAIDLSSCDEETIRIRLLAPQGTDVLPATMMYIQDSVACNGGGASPLFVGTLAMADDAMDDDLGISLCWQPDVDDFAINGGSYQLEFLADFPGALQPSRVTVTVQVLECDIEVDLFPDFDPGFTSGIGGESQFDLDGDGDLDFLDRDIQDVMGPSNRWDQDFLADLDTMTLVPSEVVEFSFTFSVLDPPQNPGPMPSTLVCFTNRIDLLDILDPPAAPYQRGPGECGPMEGMPPMPCFITIDGIFGESSTGSLVQLTAPPVYPLTLDQFEAEAGWPAGDTLVSVTFQMTAAPTVDDIGNNLVSYRITDATGHISDPQVNFVVVGCFDPPCCLIDQYQIEGVDDVVRDIPTEPIVVPGPDGPIELVCDGEPMLQPAGDGIIDVFPNQTVSFVVNGRMETDCPGARLTINKDESGGDIFPAGVMCVDLDGVGTEYVCLGEAGAVDSDVKAFIEWTPTTADISDEVYLLRFTVTDGAGRTTGCLVRIRVCPEPVCSGTFTLNDDDPMQIDFLEGGMPSTFTVTSGDTFELHICGEQDCGEFVLGLPVTQAIYRTISIEPTQATCELLCALGCMDANIDCTGVDPVCSPILGIDNPGIDSDNADGDNNDMTGAEDPFMACQTIVCEVPVVEDQTSYDLCFQITDASGKPQECCVTIFVCPPVYCEPTEIMFNGEPAPMGFDPMVDTMTIAPGENNLSFKITGFGGCEGETLQVDNVEIICLDEMGMVITPPMCADGDMCCTLEETCVVTDLGGMPVAFPYICDDENMCMINMSCSFGADWYELCDKIIVQATVTSGAGGEFEQTSTCGVMVEVGPCPDPPVCMIDADLCTLTGDEADNAIVVRPGELVDFDVLFSDPNDCYGAKIKWSATGLPAWMDPHTGGVAPDTFECPDFMINCTGTPMAGDEGHYEVTFTVMDNTGNMSMCKVWIIVCEGPLCEIRVGEPELCEDSGYIEAYPGQEITFDFITSSMCPIEAFEGRPIIVNWSIKGDVPAGFTCDPEPPAMGMYVPLDMGVFESECSWTPTADQVGTYTIVFNTMDNCGRMNECEVTVRVCEPPVCEMTVIVNGSPVLYDPNNPLSCIDIYPGEDLAVTFCGAPGSSECDDLPLTLTMLSAPAGGPTLTFNPALPLMGMVGQDGRLCTDGTLIPGPLDVSDTKYVWSFGIEDSCGRVSEDICELRVRVLPCEPICEVLDIELDGSPYDPSNIMNPITPGQTLTYTIKGSVGCVVDGLGLELLCDLPDGAVVTPGDLVTMPDQKVTMREWDIEWTPLAGDYCADEQGPMLVEFECSVSVTPAEAMAGLEPASCDLDVYVGECPPPLCAISDIIIIRNGMMMTIPYDGSIVYVQPDDMVEFVVSGESACPEGAENTLTIYQKAESDPEVSFPFPPGAMMNDPLPTSGDPDGPVMSTFTWTPMLDQCGEQYEARFNIGQTCGPDSEEECVVIFSVGICEEPPVCVLEGFMFQPNPATCFNPNPEEEIPFQDLPFEEVDDGYAVSVRPGDTVKLTFCGETECTCTSLTLDADGLPEGAVITCYDEATDSYLPSEFPHVGEQNMTPLCCMVEFVVPPTGSFHVTFIVSDSDDQTPDAECVLWVDVEKICDDYEPNDDCDLPQEICVTSDDPEVEPCGPYLSGMLEERVTPGCQPDTFLVLFNKQNQIINMNNNGSNVGNSKGSGLYDITTANGLSEGNGDDRWLRIGVTGYPDGLVQPFNGYPQNGPHGQLGEFQMTVTFYDGAGEIISPAIVQDANGNDVIIDNPYVYTNEFVTGAEAFRVNFQAPRAMQGGGVTASASIEIDNTTGLDPLCNDVDFFKYTGLVPFTDYCITAVGGLSKDCTPIDLQLGWFDKSCFLLLIDCDSGPNGVAELCVVADTNGEVIIGVTGKGDDDFDGYLTPPMAAPADGRAVDGCPDPSTHHGVCGCYTLCIMTFDPHTGELVDRSPNDVLHEQITDSMHHGDMNMDGKTDTADLGMLMGRFGWSATDGVDRADAPASEAGQGKALRPGVVSGKTLSGAMEE